MDHKNEPKASHRADAHARTSTLALRCLSLGLLAQVWLALPAIGQNNAAPSQGSKMDQIAKLPMPLQALIHATTFDDSVQGESASLNYKNYAQASSQIQALETKDLQYLLAQGSPAGRLYAAVLLKESGRVGNSDCFGKLLSDNADVNYLSGCKGSTYKVKDIASGFIKDGYFNNFKFSQYCKLKTPVTSASTPPASDRQIADSAQLIADTQVLEHFQQVDSNQPARAWQAFIVLLQHGAAARPQIDQMLSAKGSATRLYGVILLQQLDKAKASVYLKKWQSDQSRVVFSQGCAKAETTVANLAQRLLNGETLVLLKNPN